VGCISLDLAFVRLAALAFHARYGAGAGFSLVCGSRGVSSFVDLVLLLM
jgi:hypothetical protein